jgi:hypothetical protein
MQSVHTLITTLAVRREGKPGVVRALRARCSGFRFQDYD